MSTGAIRYNYQQEAWEFSNDRSTWHQFAPALHTHRSLDIEDATPNANAGAVVRRGNAGEASFSRITIGGSTQLDGPFLRVGASNPIIDPDQSTVSNITLTGPLSNFKTVVQDGAGRVNLLWNATRANGGRYLTSNEPAARVMIDAGGNGGRLGFFSATAGLANQDIVWRRRLLIDSDGSVHIGPSDDPLVRILPSGALHVDRGRVFAQAFETQSARHLKRNIEVFREDALVILNAIPIYTFTYQRDETNQTRVGFIADEVDDSRVSGTDHDRFDVASTVGLLIKAVQELSARVAILEERAN